MAVDRNQASIQVAKPAYLEHVALSKTFGAVLDIYPCKLAPTKTGCSSSPYWPWRSQRVSCQIMVASSLLRPTRSLSCWPVYCLRSTFVLTIAPLRKCLSFPTVCARLSNCLGHPITLLFGGSQGTS